MARVCSICEKRTEGGKHVARRGLPKKKGGVGLRCTGRTLRKFKPNIQKVRAVVDGVVTRVRVSAKALRMGVIVKPPKRTWKPAESAA